MLTLDVGSDFPAPRPGQFVSVEASPQLALPRPFAVAGWSERGFVELLIEVRGSGTRALADAQIGSSVGLMGPLGNAFTTPPQEATTILVGGGVGVAGVRFLAHELSTEGRKLMLLAGARTSELLLDNCLPGRAEPRKPERWLPGRLDGRPLEDRLSGSDRADCETRVATDDGSRGFCGPVTALLAKVLDAGEGPWTVYCCGPRAMAMEAARVTTDRGVPCEVTLEEIMACGVGACRGCVVETTNGYRCVCSDGPVFEAASILLKEPSHA
jgi:dihydroorotate dehydrogenase electron transfer subunit